MRPRVFPAEDRWWITYVMRYAQASMRPRVFPAEDAGSRPVALHAPVAASMRPRVFPAEDT